MKNFYLLLLILFLEVFACEKASASHIAGGDITYVAVPGAPNQIVVTVNLYRDCGGIGYEDSVLINLIAPSGCGVDGNTRLGLVPGTGPGNEIQTGNAPSCAITTCNGGTAYGVEKWVYSGLVDLGDSCQDWMIRYVSCCRSTGFPLSNIYLATTLNNLNFPSDNSPVFNHPPVATFCAGRTHQLDMSCIDPDGDSLIYILDTAYVSNPMPSINPFTGIVTFPPSAVQAGVLVVLVQSYSRTTGQYIGTIRREIEVMIEAVCHDLPTFDSLRTVTNANLLSCNDSLVQIKLDWLAQCMTLASDGSDFLLFSPSHVQVPVTQAVAYNCTGGLSDSLSLYFGAPGLFENGIYALIVKNGFDGNTILDSCGLAIPQNDTSFFAFNNCFTGIDELNISNSFLHVFPVPTQSTLSIATNVSGLKEFQVFSPLGALLQTMPETGFSREFDFSDLPAGVYSLSMISAHSRKSAFFVILR